MLGSDVAGEVLVEGSAVTRFTAGDRVLGHAAFLEKSRNKPAEGAFQRVIVILEHMASPIPAGMVFVAASVLPLGLSTSLRGVRAVPGRSNGTPAADD